MTLAALQFLRSIVTSVVLTDCVSMQAALGVGSRPACTRIRDRNAATIVFNVPPSRHAEKS